MYPAEHREYWAREPSRRAITKLATLTNKTEDEVITEVMDFARRTREMTGIVLMEWQVIQAYEVTYGAADIQPLQTPNARRDARSTLYAITRQTAMLANRTARAFPTLTDTTRFNPAVVEPLTAALSHLTNATLELKTVTDALTQQINTENNNQEQPNASERGKE